MNPSVKVKCFMCNSPVEKDSKVMIFAEEEPRARSLLICTQVYAHVDCFTAAAGNTFMQEFRAAKTLQEKEEDEYFEKSMQSKQLTQPYLPNVHKTPKKNPTQVAYEVAQSKIREGNKK